MPRIKTGKQRWLAALAVLGCFAATGATQAIAQGTPGLTIFSGIDREYELGYLLEEGGVPARRDRYRLRVPRSKMELAVAQFAITYPDTYDGTFDPDDIRLEVDDEEVEAVVVWNEEEGAITIRPVEPVPANTSVEFVFSGVRNPRSSGMHYFNCMILTPGDQSALMRYVGTWIIKISS